MRHTRKNSGLVARRRGAVLIEAAIVVGVLTLLSFGLIECGDWFFVQHSLAGAAREGARKGVVSGSTNADVTTSIQNTMSAAGYSSGSYSVSINPSDVSKASPGTQISVTVSGIWGTMGVRPLGLLSATAPISGVAVMQKE